MTPVREPYPKIKKQHPDTIVFCRLGDFYETFADDARIVSEVCQVVLTGRDMEKGQRVPIAGLPYHAADTYITKLIQAGHKVAIAEQINSADSKAPGRTLITRVVARVGDACNIFGDPEIVHSKLEVLQQHCEKDGRNFGEIERTNLTGVLLARNKSDLKAKRERLNAPEPFRGYAITVPQAIALVGRHEKAGSQMFICSFFKNDWESVELLAEEVMPHFK